MTLEKLAIRENALGKTTLGNLLLVKKVMDKMALYRHLLLEKMCEKKSHTIPE